MVILRQYYHDGGGVRITCSPHHPIKEARNLHMGNQGGQYPFSAEGESGSY